MVQILKDRLFQLSKATVTYLRSCIHTQPHTSRYKGYVNKFPLNSNPCIGFIVRQDKPDQEYIFHTDDIKAEDTPLVRQYDLVEFDIMWGKPYNRAKQITAPSGQLLKYTHTNASLDLQDRTQRLSRLPNAFNQRFTGIVHSINSNTNNGFITPDMMHCDLIYFDYCEIQTTGIATLNANDAVSFYVADGKTLSQSRSKNRKDVALCIKRKDGGLITVEDFELGNHRRSLGEMYNEYDTVAQVPSQYINDRYRGYIIHKQKDGLLGYILPFDERMNGELISLHVDDCHVFGNRKLRRFEEVEFYIKRNDASDGLRCGYKAVQVTAPNLNVMCYNKDNYLVNIAKDKAFSLDMKGYDEMRRFEGIISDIKQNKYYQITPNMFGYKPVIGNASEVRVVGTRALQIGDAVEFHVATETQNAFHITAPGGYPFVCEYSNSEYSQYLRSKCTLSTFRRDFVSYCDESCVEGFICSFDAENECGTIEIIGTDDIRYKNILFDAKDVKRKQLKVLKNQKVRFELVDVGIIDATNNVEFFGYRGRSDLDLTKKAINVKRSTRNRTDGEKRLLTMDQTYESNSRISKQRDAKITQINRIVQQKISYLRY